jgi:hypothetical protein
MKSIRLSRTFLMATAVLAAGLVSPTAVNAASLYYGLWSSIGRSGLDGSGYVNLVSSAGMVGDMEVDTAAGKIYWGDMTNPGGTNRLYRANLDGSNRQTLDTVTAGIGGVALDSTANRVYFGSMEGLYRANLDGTGLTQILSGYLFNDLEIYAGKVYWSSVYDIKRANLDGTGVETLVSNQSSIVGLDVVGSQGKMFWADQSSGLIQSANLNGSGVFQIAAGQSGARGIVVDTDTNHVYWGQEPYLRMSNLDGTNLQSVNVGYLGVVELQVTSDYQTNNWISLVGGAWDTGTNWSKGTAPGVSDNVIIKPSNTQVVTGNLLPTTVHSLVISAMPGGSVQLQVQSTGPLTVTGNLAIESGATLQINGVVNSSTQTTNSGTVEMVAGGLLAGGVFQNVGVVQGSGQIVCTLANQAGGEIRVGSGQKIVITGSSNTNSGRIEVIQGENEFAQGLTNQSAGRIDVRDAILRVGTGLANQGSINVSFGTTDIFGTIGNQSSGKIILSGNSNTTFWDNVTNAGSIKVSAGSTAVFYGALFGTGITDTGTIFLEGGIGAVAGASIQLFGNDDGLSSPLVNIENDSTAGLMVNGVQHVGAVNGTGNTYIVDNGILYADSIRQNTISIGGSVPAMASVPEPAAFSLLGIGVFGLLVLVGRRTYEAA